MAKKRIIDYSLAEEKIEITEEDQLLRRVMYVDPRHIKPDGTPSSFAFKLRNKHGEDGLSVDIERLIESYEKSVADRSKFRLFRLRVNTVTSLGLQCEHDPLPDNYAHALITGKFTSSIPGKLARLAEPVDL